MRNAAAILVSAIVLGQAVPAFAQRNPFADDEKAEDSKKTKKMKKASSEEEAKKESDAAEEQGAEAGEATAKQATAQSEEKAEPEPEPAPETEEVVEAPAAVEAAAGRVPLTQNFSKAELITSAVILPLGLGFAIGGPALFGEPTAGMTSPRLGSVDYRLSIASHGDLREGAPFVFGIFDIGGIAYPAALGTFYLVSGLYLWGADEPMLSSQSVNFDHSMIGMAQTAGWTALSAGLVHLFLGREKPYAAFGRTAYGSAGDKGSNLSFVSTATAMSFALSSFAARDYSDWAVSNGQGYVTGVILPYAILYGMSATIGYSAIFGQQHYFSDIAVSAVLGSLIGHLSYVAHFDRDGNPRERREAVSVTPTLLQSPGGEMKMGLGFGAQF